MRKFAGARAELAALEAELEAGPDGAAARRRYGVPVDGADKGAVDSALPQPRFAFELDRWYPVLQIPDKEQGGKAP